MSADSIRRLLPGIACVAIFLICLTAIWICAWDAFQSPTLRYEGLDKFVLWCVAGCYVFAFPLWLANGAVSIALSWATKARMTGR